MLINLEQLPKTTQQAEKLKTRDLKDLFNILLATILHWAENDDVSSTKELQKLSSEIEFIITAIENKNKNSGLKKSTIAIIAMNLINIIYSWEKLSDKEKEITITNHTNKIRNYKILYRASKSGNR
jgi:hypothetical protein